MTVTLYGYWRSSCSWRVRIALALKNIPYTNALVPLLENVQHGEAYRQRNPMRQVPTLEWDDADGRKTLTQSLAILRWLEAQHPQPPLWPADPYLAAQATAAAEIMNAGIQPLQNLAIGQQLKEQFGCDDATVKAWNAHWIARGLVAVEALARGYAGKFCIGGDVTVSDLCLIPQLYSARRFGVDLAPYPTLTRIEATCVALPAFQAAHADAQPDACGHR